MARLDIVYDDLLSGILNGLTASLQLIVRNLLVLPWHSAAAGPVAAA